MPSSICLASHGSKTGMHLPELRQSRNFISGVRQKPSLENLGIGRKSVSDKKKNGSQVGMGIRITLELIKHGHAKTSLPKILIQLSWDLSIFKSSTGNSGVRLGLETPA